MSSIALSSGHHDWTQLAADVTQVAPSAQASQVVGVQGNRPVRARLASGTRLENYYISSLPLQALVGGPGPRPALLRDSLSEAQWQQASGVLGRGGVMLFVPDDLPRGPSRDTVTRVRLSVGGSKHGRRVEVPVAVVVVTGTAPPTMGVVSPPVAEALHLRVQTVGLLVSGATLSGSQESRLAEIVRGLDDASYVYTERGYQVGGRERIVLWILFGLAGVLMLGGTLTATFLALSDARPDLATLSAVGASPRTRRAVAASYAVAVGLVGGVLGAAVGFVPGVAISYPLTRTYAEVGPSHYLDVPWLEIAGLVVLLPLLTALVVGLVARSRLPLVARLD
jgi:putative ABC transport system permease protein